MTVGHSAVIAFSPAHVCSPFAAAYHPSSSSSSQVIEVNTNPYIGCSSALLKKIFTGMLEGALRKCVDPYFAPPEGCSAADIEDVEGCSDWVKVYPPEDRKSKKGSETG
jgi:hypothetical protein